MTKSLNDLGILVLRLFAGLTMLVAHGWPKLTGCQDKMNVFPDPLGVGSSLSLGLAVFSEVLCAALLTLGIFTRLASLNLLITMAVAFFMVHASDPFNAKELAFVYLGMYIVLLITGGGKYSLFKHKNPILS